MRSSGSLMWIVAFLGGCLLWSPLMGQEAKFSVEARLVQIEVRVTRDGRPVSGLPKEAFALFENGQPQTVATLQWVGARAGAAPAVSLNAPQLDGTALSQRQAEGLPEVRQEVPELTWVYISPETEGPLEFRRAAEGIRSFLTQSSLEGRRVSLGGLPFTSDRTLLLNTLDRMVDRPYGDGEVASGVNPEILHLSDLEFMREVAKAVTAETSMIQLPVGFEHEDVFKGPLSQVPAISVETIDRQIMFFGDLALYRYLDLIRRLAVFPGRKVVVLFRSGLRLDVSSVGLMRDLTELAQRYRVSFYTIDARGLNVPSPVRERKFALAWDSARTRNYLPNVLVEEDRFLESQAGLVILARNTGGRAILDTNGFGSVFETISDDSSNYYLLGFYPSDLEEKGRFRKVEVKVGEPGVKVEATRGYYERKPVEKLTSGERQISLRLALENLQSGGLEVPLSTVLFADAERRPMLHFSLGTRLSGIEGRRRGRDVEVEASVLVRVSDTYSQKLPLYQEQTLEHRLPQAQFEAGSKDESVFLTYGSKLPLNPGLYNVKAVIRDRRSGKLGIASRRVVVPDFTQPSTASSLLITRTATPVANPDGGSDGAGSGGPSLLAAGGRLYTPQPVAIFHRGEVVHLLFHLYNPTEDDYAAAQQGMQLALLKEGRPVERAEAMGQPYLDRNGRVIRYTAAIFSGSLEPGTYTVLAIMPHYEIRKVPHLEGTFTLIE